MTQGQVTKPKGLAAAGDIAMAGQAHPRKRSAPTCGQASHSGKALSGDSCCHLAAARSCGRRTTVCTERTRQERALLLRMVPWPGVSVRRQSKAGDVGILVWGS